MKSVRPWASVAKAIAAKKACVSVATLLALSITLSAAADEYVVFTWGGWQRVVDHEVDFEAGQMKLLLGGESYILIPLSTVSKITDIDREVLLDFTLDGATMDAWDPPDAVLWSPIEGWSQEEVWRRRGSHPRWAFRWTDSETAWAVIAEPLGEVDAIELRLLSIRHAIQVARRIPEPETQLLRVSLNGQFLGELSLDGRGWQTYRLELPEGCLAGPGFLELEASYLARPADFTLGKSEDGRNLGVGVDYVRFVVSERAGLPQGLDK